MLRITVDQWPDGLRENAKRLAVAEITWEKDLSERQDFTTELHDNNGNKETVVVKNYLWTAGGYWDLLTEVLQRR